MANKKSRLDSIIGKINSGDISVKQSEQDLRGDMNKTARGVTTTATPTAASTSVNTALTRSSKTRDTFDSGVRKNYTKQHSATSPTSPLYIAPDLVPAMTTGGNASGGRVANTIAGAVKSVASQYTNTAGMAVKGAQELNTLASGTAQKVQAAQDNIARYQQEIQTLRRNGTLTNESLAHLNQLISVNNRAIQAANGNLEAQNAGTEAGVQSLNQTADKLQTAANANIATAKQGLGTIGSALVDIGVTGTQMATDAVASALTGGNALIPMFIRSFGGGAQQAREAGAAAGTQALYGLGSGVIETATERMFNVAAPFKKMYGEGFLDSEIKKAVAKISEGAVGRALLTAGASAAGEGFEEFVAGLIYPVLQRATYDPSAKFDLGSSLYEAVIGGALGLIGATPAVIGSAMNRPTQNSGNVAQDNLASPATAQTEPASPTVTQNLNTAQNQDKQPAPKPTVSSPLSGVASTLGESGAKAITAFYDGSNPAEYAAEFVRTYNAGLNGKKAPVATNITPAQSYAAFSAGQNDAAAKAATQKVTITPQTVVNDLSNGKRRDATSYATDEEFNAANEAVESGKAHIDAAGNVFATDADQHIDNRSSDSVASRNVNAFQFDYPEVHEYFKTAAEDLMNDAARSLDNGTHSTVKRTMQGKQRTNFIEENRYLRAAMEEGMSRESIIKAANDLISDHGQENYAAAKRLELILDDMLSNGYTTLYGKSVEPSAEYIASKKKFPGASTESAHEELPVDQSKQITHKDHGSMNADVNTDSEDFIYNPDIQAINGKTWYHGTGTSNLNADRLDPNMTKIDGLLGDGIYLTDNSDVAKGYAKNRSKRTKTPMLYTAKVSTQNIIDMEKPMPTDVFNAFKSALEEWSEDGADVDSIDKLQSSGAAGIEIYRKFSDELSNVSAQNMISNSEFYDTFFNLNQALSDLGYEGYTHEGGKLVGKKRHQVLVLLDPSGNAYESANKGNIIKEFSGKPVQIDKPQSTSNTRKSSGNPDVDRMAAVDRGIKVEEPYASEWWATRVGDRDKKVMSLTDIVGKIRHDFDINVTKGHLETKGSKGEYNRHSEGVRVKLTNDLPTVSHELGHHLDNKFGLTKDLSEAQKAEIVNGLSDDMKAAYPEKKWVTEGLAEYVRKFLQNSATAAIKYPEFTQRFLNALPAEEKAMVEELADEVNAYYSLDAGTATSSIKLRNEKPMDFGSIGERIKAKSDEIYQAWDDSNHGIKLFDQAMGSHTYKVASNSAYADSVAGAILTGDLTNADGQYVSYGLMQALDGINLKNKQEYKDFGEYLVVRHGPERLAEKMLVFADDRKNSKFFMDMRQGELEHKYPEFKAAADRLYTFQKNFLQTWGVQTGLVSADSAKKWAERYQYYVPFNRDVGSKKTMGAKRGYANQNSTIKQAHGSTLDIIHPVDSIVNNMVKMVNAAIRNNVMVTITDVAKKNGENATFLEEIPTPMKKVTVDIKGVKDKLKSAIKDSDMSKRSEDIAYGLVDGIDDILQQYGRGKAYGDVITVLRNGSPEFWKINDPLLLSSVTNMDAPKVMPWLEAYGSVSRFMTANITGNNIIWSIFSNAPRDLMTYFTFSSDKNPVHILGGIGSAYANKVRGKNADPMFKEYLAMGGGKTSMYTADINLAKKIRNKISQDSKLSWLNPIEWMNFVSDTIELGPRYSYYKIMREKGYTPQEAFYESTDITVNFRRSGVNSRTLNYVIPFFNAGVQGIDKFGRWISASEVTDGSRGKVARSRMISFMATSAALAALIYGLNSSDDDKKKDYAQLSNYTKNSFWCIPMGDGKYFTIPKPREIAVLSSLMEAAAEYYVNGNKHAMDDFYGYAANTILPNGVSDFALGDFVGAFSSIGLIGTVFYMGANRDFLGNPIVGSGLINLEPKDQYTRRTSMIAKTVGDAFNVSPSMVDFFFQNTLGGWWKAQKALFPVGSENVDLTLGVQGTYVRDNQYSTDLTNWLYTQLDKDSKKKYSNPDDMSAALQYKWDSLMSSFYSTYNKLAKDKAETTGSRATRQTVLDMIIEYRKSYESGTTPKAQKTVNDICTSANSTEFAPSVMQSTVKDANDTQHTLSDIQYVEYQTEYLKLYWEYVDATLPKAKTQVDKEAVLTAAKKMAKDTATTNALKRIGAPTIASEYKGVNDSSVVEFKAAVSSARSDGSLTQDEVLDILDRMMISDANRSTLFRSIYTSDKNNPWA